MKVFTTFFCNFATKVVKFFDLKVQSFTHILRLGKKKEKIFFVLHSTFRNFVAKYG